MNSKNSKTSDPHGLLRNLFHLTGNINLEVIICCYQILAYTIPGKT